MSWGSTHTNLRCLEVSVMTSEKTSQPMPASSSRSVMRAAVPLSARTGSVTMKALVRLRRAISGAIWAIAPLPK